MDAEDPSVEDRILVAAIECVERYGITGATTRRIAEAAGVNVAAINYYYRSKDNLIDAAMKRTMENSFGEWEKLVADGNGSLEDRLRAMLDELFAGSKQYPGLTRAHLHGPIADGDYQAESAVRFRRLTSLIAEAIRAEVTGVSAKEARSRAIRFLSAATLPAVSPGLFHEMGDGGPGNSAVARYIDDLIGSALDPRTR